MKSKFFIQNLSLFLIPLLIPVLILGTLSIKLTLENARGEILKNNTELLTHIHHNIDLIFSELNTIQISVSNPEVVFALEEVLRTQTMSLENKRLLDYTRNYINSPAYSRPYIHSIYVYLDNPYDQFLSTKGGINNLETYYDSKWIESFRENKKSKNIWTESRAIQQYTFEKPKQITTIYKTIYSTITKQPTGVIALNIYTSYFESLIKHAKKSPQQTTYILDDQDHVIFSTQTGKETTIIEELPSVDKGTFQLETNNQTYMGFQIQSNQSGWRFVTLLPEVKMYQIPLQISTYTLLLVLVSLFLGVLLTFYLTKRNDIHIRKIISIFEFAEKGMPIPAVHTTKIKNEFNYIEQNIIKNFLEHNYLKVQLSEKKYRIKTAELIALQSQMNPHFLFNTLETIYWKALGLTGKYNSVNYMLENLSDLLKYSLEEVNKLVPIEEEIEMTKAYIKIQKVRYKDQFTVQWDYDENVIRNYEVIKLVLQPLIENSISHGIRESKRKGQIKVRIKQQPSWLRITVIDNGIGMKPEQLQNIRQNFEISDIACEHIGLVNTHKRLQLTYGDKYSMTLRSKYMWGTAISIRIPNKK